MFPDEPTLFRKLTLLISNRVFTNEYAVAIILAFMLVLIFIFAAIGTAPRFVYSGF